jgi:hypothetical protein
MLRRLIFGLVLGLIVGGVLAAGLVKLGVLAFAGDGGAALAYIAACITGALTGVIAGKPIWASEAKIEGGLKAAFGALMGAGAMFVLRQWAGGIAPDLSAIGAGAGPIGDSPALSLPVIAAVLGALFGLDNTDSPKQLEGPARKRVAEASGAGRAGAKAKARPSAAEVDDGDEAEVVSKRAKR